MFWGGLNLKIMIHFGNVFCARFNYRKVIESVTLRDFQKTGRYYLKLAGKVVKSLHCYTASYLRRVTVFWSIVSLIFSNVFVMLFVSVFLFILGFWAIRWYLISTLPSVKEYKLQNPKAVDKKGNVRCIHCNSNNVYLWWLFGPAAGYGPKKHICRKCGITLWKS